MGPEEASWAGRGGTQHVLPTAHLQHRLRLVLEVDGVANARGGLQLARGSLVGQGDGVRRACQEKRAAGTSFHVGPLGRHARQNQHTTDITGTAGSWEPLCRNACRVMGLMFCPAITHMRDVHTLNACVQDIPVLPGRWKTL